MIYFNCISLVLLLISLSSCSRNGFRSTGRDCVVNKELKSAVNEALFPAEKRSINQDEAAMNDVKLWPNSRFSKIAKREQTNQLLHGKKRRESNPVQMSANRNRRQFDSSLGAEHSDLPSEGKWSSDSEQAPAFYLKRSTQLHAQQHHEKRAVEEERFNHNLKRSAMNGVKSAQPSNRKRSALSSEVQSAEKAQEQKLNVGFSDDKMRNDFSGINANAFQEIQSDLTDTDAEAVGEENKVEFVENRKRSANADEPLRVDLSLDKEKRETYNKRLNQHQPIMNDESSNYEYDYDEEDGESDEAQSGRARREEVAAVGDKKDSKASVAEVDKKENVAVAGSVAAKASAPAAAPAADASKAANSHVVERAEDAAGTRGEEDTERGKRGQDGPGMKGAQANVPVLNVDYDGDDYYDVDDNADGQLQAAKRQAHFSPESLEDDGGGPVGNDEMQSELGHGCSDVTTPEPKEWDDWGVWSECSASCGNGTSARWRHCKGGPCEPGEKEAQVNLCNTEPCSPSEPHAATPNCP